MKNPYPPPTVPGSKEDSHWIIRDSLAADSGAVRRFLSRNAWELAALTIAMIAVLGCCTVPLVIVVPYLAQPYVRLFIVWRRRRAVQRASRLRPAEPWTWPVDAGADGIERRFERTRRGHRFLFAGLALLGLTILIVASFGVGPLIVIPGIPIALFLWLGYRDVRTGKVRLKWTAWPLVTGRRAEFTLGVSDGGARFERAMVRLRAIEEHPSRTHLVWCTWTDLCHLASDTAPGPGHDALIAFDVPAAARGTRLDVPEACWWEIEVTGSSDAGQIRERFAVPIYDPLPPDPPTAA